MHMLLRCVYQNANSWLTADCNSLCVVLW